MDAGEYRILKQLLSNKRQGVAYWWVIIAELDGYPGQLKDLQAQGLVTPGYGKVELTERGMQIAEGLPAKWQDQG